MITFFHGLEDRRDAGAGSHRSSEVAPGEPVSLTVGEVDCDSREGRVEILDQTLVLIDLFIDEVLQRLAGVESRKFLLSPEGELPDCFLDDLYRNRDRLESFLDLAGFHKMLDFGEGNAGAIEPAHYGAHAVAHDQVGFEPFFLQHFQDAHMGGTTGAAAAKSQCHPGFAS